MTVGLAAGIVNTFLDTTFGTTFVKLHTADPGAAGATAAAAGDTTRKAATMAVASAALSASQPWVSTNTFTLTSLTVSISPLAA